MNRLFPRCLVVLLAFAGVPAAAQDNPFASAGRLPVVRSSVLPVDEAFALNAFIEAPATVVLLWEMPENYYLYRQSIVAMDAADNVIDIGDLPEGETVTDEFFGESMVYHDRLLLRFPLSVLAMHEHMASFTLHYQGCAKDRYCYPVVEKHIELSLPE